MLTDNLAELIRTVLIVFGSVTTTYLTVAYKNRRDKKKPITIQERESYLYDRYEKTIAQLDVDIDNLRQLNQAQAKQIETMQNSLDIFREKLTEAQDVNKSLYVTNIELQKKANAAEARV